MEGGPPVFPRDFSCPAVLWILLARFSLSPTGLSPSMVCLPMPLRLDYHDTLCAVQTPKTLLPLVWPLPRSLATTSGISVDFFSSPYLDVSVQAVPLIYLCIQYMMTVHYHRRISPFGNLRINAYLRLPVAYRSLSRPSSAPSAKAFPLRSF